MNAPLPLTPPGEPGFLGHPPHDLATASASAAPSGYPGGEGMEGGGVAWYVEWAREIIW